MYIYYQLNNPMSTRTTLSISEARKKIFQISDQVQRPNIHFVLTDNGRPKVVLMSAEEFSSWQETLEVMNELPDLKDDIKEVENDIKSGKVKKYSSLEDILKKEGYIRAK